MLRRLLARRPSHATVVAYLALFLALGGGTTAVALQGRNTVDSGDIINQQVRTADVRNDNLRSADILDGTIGGIDVAFGTLRGDEIQDGTLSGNDMADDTLSGDQVGPNSLTGSDIQESTLSQVPTSSFSFDTARIENQRVQPLSHFGAAGSSSGGVQVGALSVSMSCNAQGVPRVLATTSQNNAKLWSLPNADEDDDFDTGESHDVKDPADARGSGTAVYWVAGRNPVTMTLAYSDLGTSCVVAGRAVG